MTWTNYYKRRVPLLRLLRHWWRGEIYYIGVYTTSTSYDVWRPRP